MLNKFNKGSEWRRWETHIHTPGTIKNDQFRGADLNEKWENFIEDVNNYSDEISVIAITDYLCSNNYFRFKKEVLEGKITKHFDLILPNIELRISPVTGSSTPLNIHCIFNPKFDDKLNDRFYNKLKFHYQTRDYIASRGDLIELGRKYKNNPSLDEPTAYKEGIKVFVPSFDNLKIIFDQDSELRENCIIIVSNKSNDGVSGLNAHAELIEGEKFNSLDATRQTIYHLCDGIFSSNERDLKYFLGEGVDNDEEVKRKCKNLKPCLHGCDAHENRKIFEPDHKRYCWIKSDPTFEGFKQIIYEPKSRIRIQEEKPEQKRPHLYIEKVKFIGDTEDKTFTNQYINFNSNLNSIIGGKSSGKSLLLYYTAKSIDPKQIEEKFSEISGKEGYTFESDVPNFDFEVVWGDGLSYKLSDPESIKARQITYVPQMYINHLAEKRGNEDLKKIIQTILEEKKDFLEFYTTAKEKISRIKGQIASNIYEYFQLKERLLELEELIKNKGDKEARNQNLTNRRDELAKLRLESGFTQAQETEYSALINSQTTHLNRKQNLEILLDSIQNDYQSELTRIESAVSKALDKIKDNALPKFTNNKILIDLYSNKTSGYKGKLLYPFGIIQEDIKKYVEQINRCIELTNNKIQSYQNYLNPYLEKITKKEKLEEIQADINLEESTLAQIAELEQQDKTTKKQLQNIKDEVIKDYTSMMFSYQSIVQEVNSKYSQINSDRQIKLKSVLSFDSERFKNNCLRFITKNVSFTNTFGSYFNSFDFIFTEPAHITDIKDFFEKILINDVPYNKGGSQSLVCEKMFEDYFIIDFEIFQKDESIFKMSPGKKGLILLYLILHLSNASYPILIDQPEDNLDNRTVYKELKDFMKEKKIERQIIIVTHNANLVVPTDSENVIIANQSGQDNGKDNADFKFEYVSGSLENNFINKAAKGILNQMGVRDHVCDILEGGEIAFKEREIRYSIS